MQTIYIAIWFDENHHDEYEAVFKDGVLLDAWHRDDAIWSGERMDSFLMKLGIEVMYKAPTELDILLIKQYLGVD